jgi:chromosomal replication initiator protein
MLSGRQIAPQALVEAINHQREVVPTDNGALDRLIAYLETNRPTIKEIKDAVSIFYGIDRTEISSRYRSYETALARQIFCYLAYRYTRFSMAQIGRFVGLSNHTTVLHAIRKIERLRISKPLLADDLDLLRLAISERVLLRLARPV